MLVHGMFMDGCRWDEEEMVVTDSIKGVMNSALCMFHMEPKMDFVPDPADYIAPLYKTSARAGVLSTTGESGDRVEERREGDTISITMNSKLFWGGGSFLGCRVGNS